MSVLLTESSISAIDRIRINGIFWKWYKLHQNDVILRRFLFAVRVRDIYQVFVWLFGPEPVGSEEGR